LTPATDRRELAAIFAGGALGAVARVALVETGAGGATLWPWPTFTANVLGSFLLGCFSTRLQERLPQSAYGRPLLGTGLCGALTTFSTFQVELLAMLDRDRVGLASGYLLASLAAGYAATHLATAATRRVRRVA
jgi:fluoride exporter